LYSVAPTSRIACTNALPLYSPSSTVPLAGSANTSMHASAARAAGSNSRPSYVASATSRDICPNNAVARRSSTLW
jgi:hypothetical protein